MINAFINVCWAENLKLRRSKTLLMAAIAYAMAPVATTLLMLASKDPVRARFYDLITIDSQIQWMQADWPRYFDALAGASAVAGLIVFGLFMIWIFGREHADHTSKELLTMPIPREAFAMGKIFVAALWCVVLQLGMIAIALLLGGLLKLPSWSYAALSVGLIKIFSVATLTFCLAIPFGLIANLSRGTMAAVGALFMAIFFALIMTAMGWGAYFPWSIPALYSASPGLSVSSLSTFSFYLVGFTGLAGVLGNMWWWRRADQH